jgi:hypothetical protein
MRLRALAFLAASLVHAGCGCSALDRTGHLDPDALVDADDAVEVHVDVDAAEVHIDADAPDVPDGDDPPADPVEEETGCGSDEECSDGEPCNGTETCGPDGECHDGTPLEDGSPCVSAAGVDGICIEQVCRPPGCGDGHVTGSEECDDENTTAGDGCENDCTFSCHADGECDDADVCTDDACVAGGTGQLCSNAFNTAPCDDANDCTYDDACNGAGVCSGTSYICTLGVCEVTSVCDGTGGCTVTYASPGTGCSDLDACTHTDVCDGSGGCSGTAYSCTPGQCEATSACDGTGGCTTTPSPPTRTCDDMNDCTHTDHCDGAGSCTGTAYTCTPGVCQASSVCDGTGGCTVTYASPGTGCSDLDPCTHTDVCDGSGGCSGTTYTCTAGTCEASSVCDGTGGCTVTYSAPGTACSDAYRCTTGDSCDGSGTCLSGSTLDDSLCSPGEICRPTCFPSGGCGVPPAALEVKCDDTQVLTADAACTITLDGLAGQIPCLACETEIGMVTLSLDHFTGTGGACGLGGWSLVTGPNCRDRIDEGAGCTPGGAVKTCCSDASTIDDDVYGDCMLRTDKGTNCGGSGDSREWRITRDYDTRGLADLELCFRIGDDRATDNDGILVYAIDPTHSEQVFCLEGPPVAGNVDFVEWPYCVDLSATWPWVEDNANLTLLFIAHSHDDNDVLFLDDVVLRGWSDTCTPTRTTVFTEDFDPCPGTDPIPDGWNGWSIVGGPSCDSVCTGGSAGGAVSSSGTWTMTHGVDTSTIDGDVTLCFDVGDDDSDGNEYIQVLFDAADGSGWQEAWYWEDEWGTDGACRRVCLHLSDIDRDAARNPDLRIRFEVYSDSSSRLVFIDDVVVDGAVYCDGSGSVGTSSLTERSGGNYDFALSDDAGVPMGAYAVCTWDTATPPVTGAGGTRFLSP